jgi:hypothetical protein
VRVLARRVYQLIRNFDITRFNIMKLITLGGIFRVAYTFVIIFSALTFFVFFPRSLITIFWTPFLAAFGILVLFFDYPGDLPSIRSNIRVREKYERLSKNIFYSLVVLTGYWIGLENFGTLASLILIVAVSFLVFGKVFLYALGKWEEHEKMTRGYKSLNGKWQIDVQEKDDYTLRHLTVDETPVPISRREAKLLIHLSRYAERKRLLNFKFLVKRFHSLMTGFQIGNWTVHPSTEPGIHLLYRKDLESILSISKRDAFWLLLSPRNSPERLIRRIKKIEPRREALRGLTYYLKNVTYTGTNAVIHTPYGEIYVEIEDGRVFRDIDWDMWDWEMKEGGFVCIIPKFPEEKSYLLSSKQSPRDNEEVIDQRDAIILSKILNIANDTRVIRKILAE